MNAEAAEALVIGEALIDIVEDPGGAREFVGGGPANIAMGLARLGHRTRLLAHIGDDPRGRQIAAHFAAEGVALHVSPEPGARTATALARLAADGSASYRFDIEWRVPGDVDPSPFALLHVGSIGLFLEPGGTEVVEIMRRADRGTIVTLDPNIRPSLIPDRDRAIARFECAVGLSDLVKLSDEDAEWLYPGLPPEGAARRILALGESGRTRAVIVTRGAEGALAVTAEAVHSVPARRVDVVDTISAGDSFMASVASSLLESGPAAVLADAEPVLERAVAAAAFAVSQAGANPPRRADLEA